jgi:alkanesulfonate monooxygenase SsuD/methylene tetrahydromethanopterin reductase-like flavin-dependent oxidoreductase (luciferase family)
MRVGIAFTPFETRADVIVRLAVRADAAGVEAIGVAEGWTHDALVLLAEVAQRTDRIRIGTSVLSVWGRTPATLAMGAAGLQRCSSGRFVLGLGAGSPPLAEGFHGIAWERPVDRLRATVTAVRALLAGDRLPSPADGARPLRLGVLPDEPVPVALAALSPASVRLAGELADAWTPFLWARSRLPQGRALVHEGAARGDRRPTQVQPGVPVALAADAAAARRLAAWWLATYATRMGPLYPRMLGERFGMGAGVRAVVDAAEKREPELPAAAEELAGETTMLGTYDEAERVVGAWLAAGADQVSLVLPPGHAEEELAAIVDVAGRLAGSATARTPPGR